MFHSVPSALSWRSCTTAWGRACVARIAQPHRLHRPEAQRVHAARRHHFDRQAGLEIGRGLFPFLEVGLLARQQRGDEGFVLRFVQRQVDVIGARRRRGLPCHSATGTRRCRNRSTRGARWARWRRRRPDARRRSASRDRRRPARAEVSGPVAMIAGPSRPAAVRRFLRARCVMRGCCSSALVTAAEKPCRSTASAPPAGSLWASAARIISEPARRISSCSRPTALFGRIVGAEGIGADQFGQAVGLVGGGAPDGPHFMQHHGHARLRPPARPLPTRPARRR